MTTITLATIAKQVKVSTKLARRRLRASNVKTVSDSRWVFTPATAKVVRAIIKGAA